MRIGWPFESRVVIVTRLCDAPSWVRTSGAIEMASAVPYPEGPESAGVSCSCTVQPLMANDAHGSDECDLLEK